MTKIDHNEITNWFNANHLERACRFYLAALNELTQLNWPSDFRRPNIVLAVKDPERWIGCALAAIQKQHRVWFCSPQWGIQEWNQAMPIIRPDLLWVDNENLIPSSPNPEGVEPLPGQALPGIMIPTGGSSGSIRFAWHTMDTLGAAVDGMSLFFNKRPPLRGDFGSICRLPLWHVSGWMQLIRALVTDSEFRIAPASSNDSEQGWLVPDFRYSRSWLSLVPTQLARILTMGKLSFLRSFDCIVIGGGACPRSLLEQAWQASLRPWITYGLTETAGMIAAALPDSQQSDKENASIFPHTDIRSVRLGDSRSGNLGSLWVRGASCCQGYNGQRFSKAESPDGWIPTGDLGKVDENGTLRISGRADRLIISGGEKVAPEEVEAVLRRHPSVIDCHVGPVPDSTWGQRVGCLVVVRHGHSFSEAALQALLRTHLSSFKIPKNWILHDAIPSDARGKRNWRALDALLQDKISQGKKTDIISEMPLSSNHGN